MTCTIELVSMKCALYDLNILFLSVCLLMCVRVELTACSLMLTTGVGKCWVSEANVINTFTESNWCCHHFIHCRFTCVIIFELLLCYWFLIFVLCKFGANHFVNFLSKPISHLVLILVVCSLYILHILSCCFNKHKLFWSCRQINWKRLQLCIIKPILVDYYPTILEVNSIENITNSTRFKNNNLAT